MRLVDDGDREGRGDAEVLGDGAHRGGEAVLVEAVFGPGAGVGDAPFVLDGGEEGLCTDGLKGREENGNG